MENGAFFLKRAIDSVTCQEYKDYEIVLVKEGLMAKNTNAGIKRARGDIIKILYMDDYLASPFSLGEIAYHFKFGWMVTGCLHDNGAVGNPHEPVWSDEIAKGINTIGSPSVLCFENSGPLLFDENLSFQLDCDLYTRLYQRYGKPAILNAMNVVIGLHPGQTTHLLSDKQKEDEFLYINKKYAK